MEVLEIAGLIAFGIFLGWIFGYVLRRNPMNWRTFVFIATFLSGGFIGTFSLDTFIAGASFSVFWIGLVIGFICDAIVRQVAKKKNWKEIANIASSR